MQHKTKQTLICNGYCLLLISGIEFIKFGGYPCAPLGGACIGVFCALLFMRIDRAEQKTGELEQKMKAASLWPQ